MATNNAINTNTIQTTGTVTFSGNFSWAGTVTGNTAVTFPTSGTLATTSQIPTGAPLTEVSDTNVTLSLGGNPSTALINAASITAGWSGTLAGTRGGTGVNNGSNTATFSGNLNFANSFTTSGNFAVTQTYTGVTNVTFPTSGTLATTSMIPSLPLSLANGGTGASLTASNGGIFYSTGSAGAILSGTATANQVLLSGASTTPSFSTATYPATTTINQLLYSSSTNVISGLATASRAQLVTDTSGIPTFTASMTDGQVVIGGTSAIPTAANLTAGNNISITNGPGSITIASTAINGFLWNNVSGTSQTAAAGNGYICSNAALTTVTLPTTIAQGATVSVQGSGVGGWVLQCAAGQVINYDGTPTSSGGSLASNVQYDSVSIVCIVANTTFAVYGGVGSLTAA